MQNAVASVSELCDASSWFCEKEGTAMTFKEALALVRENRDDWQKYKDAMDDRNVLARMRERNPVVATAEEVEAAKARMHERMNRWSESRKAARDALDQLLADENLTRADLHSLCGS
jgi:hypothetical protein